MRLVCIRYVRVVLPDEFGVSDEFAFSGSIQVTRLVVPCAVPISYNCTALG